MNYENMTVAELENEIAKMQAEIESRKESGYTVETKEISGGRTEYAIKLIGEVVTTRKSKVAYTHITVRKFDHVDGKKFGDITFHKTEAAALKDQSTQYAKQTSATVLAV